MRSERVPDGSQVPGARAPSPVRPPEPANAWIAEIEWGRLDGQAGFRASARESAGAAPVTLAESPPLEWPPSGPGSVEALTSAVLMLEASMLAAGWRPVGGGDSWYAKRFAWEPEPADEPPGDEAAPRLRLVPASPERPPDPAPVRPGGPFARTPPWPEGARDLWRCEIAWCAGWAQSSFEAVVYRPKGRRGRAIGASSAPRWLLMRQPDEASVEARLAVQRLSAALVATGWSPVEPGLTWYAQRFLWRRDGEPPAHVQPVVPADFPDS
jgi:hypothetical protein